MKKKKTTTFIDANQHNAQSEYMHRDAISNSVFIHVYEAFEKRKMQKKKAIA